jgi:hypothetical protein
MDTIEEMLGLEGMPQNGGLGVIYEYKLYNVPFGGKKKLKATKYAIPVQKGKDKKYIVGTSKQNAIDLFNKERNAGWSETTATNKDLENKLKEKKSALETWVVREIKQLGNAPAAVVKAPVKTTTPAKTTIAVKRTPTVVVKKAAVPVKTTTVKTVAKPTTVTVKPTTVTVKPTTPVPVVVKPSIPASTPVTTVVTPVAPTAAPTTTTISTSAPTVAKTPEEVQVDVAEEQAQAEAVLPGLTNGPVTSPAMPSLDVGVPSSTNPFEPISKSITDLIDGFKKALGVK